MPFCKHGEAKIAFLCVHAKTVEAHLNLMNVHYLMNIHSVIEGCQDNIINCTHGLWTQACSTACLLPYFKDRHYTEHTQAMLSGPVDKTGYEKKDEKRFKEISTH